MSLFSFFPLQRRHWRKLAPTLPPEFVAGALTALHLAEKTFRAAPQHNLHVQIHQLQHQLDEAVYKQLRDKEELLKLQEKLAAVCKPPAEPPPAPPTMVGRRALRKILKVVTHAQLLPANKLNLIEELTLAALMEIDQQPAEPVPQSPDPPLPLP